MFDYERFETDLVQQMTTATGLRIRKPVSIRIDFMNIVIQSLPIADVRLSVSGRL
ncbi:MAG: hypothetical protein HFI91_07790 [Lachnospiraceae bacterium]|jgi:hypothetical protein|nr:hypothetical protein [Lachnospiraceae bacterium]